ncbi:hypothetical protein GCM10022403_084260 [Streptomyces coacervatus]|uniref:Uncharacterized protein n=1 Tax=Streptomyces coacervatus TaxID=647381 RepID=A0ABP7JBA1_9ACTN|nr:hypothetical protein [Streptomyces coacervatus]MDF2273358.1 hypothetical protein [Streptomyces coacervatus]
MDPVTVTAGCGAVTSLLRLSYLWLSTRSHRRSIALEISRSEHQIETLMNVIKRLPPGSEITKELPDGQRFTIKLPPHEAA